MKKKIFLIILICLTLIPLITFAECKQTYAILGDSWSTFKGYNNPDTNTSWFPTTDNTCEGYGSGNDVMEVQCTWWHILHSDMNLKLLGNYSFSGSPICYDGYGKTDDDAKSYSFVTRVEEVNVLANLIIIEGGINDWAAGANLGEYKYEDQTEQDLKTFRPALAYVLNYLQVHTNAKLLFIKSEIIAEDFQESIDIICQHYNVPVLLLNDVELTAWHPNIRGMRRIYNIIKNYLEVNMNTTTNTMQTTIGTNTSTTASQWQTCTHDKAERGWECPRCGRINAPWVRSCDCSRDNLTFTWSSPSTGSDEWWRQYVQCTSTSPSTQLDSETFKIHPESGPIYTTVTPSTIHKASSSICQSNSSTAKSNPNEKIECWSNGTVQWGGSDYWDEEKKCYTNGPDVSSNCVTSANSPWNQFSTLTNQLDKLQYKIEELKETK